MRARFEELNNDLIMNALGPVKKVTSESGLKTDQIDTIALDGGSMRSAVNERVKAELEDLRAKAQNGRRGPTRGLGACGRSLCWSCHQG